MDGQTTLLRLQQKAASTYVGLVLRCGLASNKKLSMRLFDAMTVRQLLLNCTNKSSAVAEMGHRDTAKWAENGGGLLCPFRGGSWVPNVAWAEAYLRTK